MELFIPVIVSVIVFVVGVLVGRAPVRPARQAEARAVKNASYFEALADKRLEETIGLLNVLAVLHRGCKNGDHWRDHTEQHPEGMTPQRRSAIQAEKIRVAEAKAARVQKSRSAYATSGKGSGSRSLSTSKRGYGSSAGGVFNVGGWDGGYSGSDGGSNGSDSSSCSAPSGGCD